VWWIKIVIASHPGEGKAEVDKDKPPRRGKTEGIL
jgi:hypothetical protein